MKRLINRRPPQPGAVRAPRSQATSVFRDFLRQLEKLDSPAPRPTREGSR